MNVVQASCVSVVCSMDDLCQRFYELTVSVASMIVLFSALQVFQILVHLLWANL